MYTSNSIAKTPQFLQFVKQFPSFQESDYSQIFLAKSENCLTNSSKDQKSTSYVSPQKKPSVYKLGNDQLQAAWKLRAEEVNRIDDQTIQDNLFKQGRLKINSEIDIPPQSWKEYSEMHKQSQKNDEHEQIEGQIAKIVKDNDLSKINQVVNQKPLKKENQKEKISSLLERIQLQQQLMLLPKNERNRAMLEQKKRDERWNKQPITHKQVAQFAKCQTQAEKQKTLQDILDQNEIKQEMAQTHNQKSKKEAFFDDMINGIKQSGLVEKPKKKGMDPELKEGPMKEQKQVFKVSDRALDQAKQSTKLNDNSKAIKNRNDRNTTQQLEIDNERDSHSGEEETKGKGKEAIFGELINNFKKISDKLVPKKEQRKTNKVSETQDKATNQVKDSFKMKKGSQYPESAFENDTKQGFNSKQKGGKLSDFMDKEILDTYKKTMKYEKNQNNKKRQVEEDESEQGISQPPVGRRQADKRGNQTQQQNNFEEYWSPQEMEEAIQDKRAFKGLYLANEKNQNLGKLKCEEIDGAVFVNSHRDQNRAMHNCLVGFVITHGSIKDRLKKKSADLIPEQLVTLERDDSEDLSEMDADEQDWETESEEGVGAPATEGKLVAKVVYIYENPYQGNSMVGYLQNVSEIKKSNEQSERSKNRKKKYWFVPKFSKLPKMIPIEISADLLSYADENSIDLTTQYVVASIKEGIYILFEYEDWRVDSYYAEVIVDKCLGARGDIEIECEALIQEFGVYNEEFTPATEEYLTKYREQLNLKGEYIIPEAEKEKRWDLTNVPEYRYIPNYKEIICTIDPPDARDLDDALSVKYLHDDVYEIGVHIADVSHFVQPDTPLDDDARLRTTSVYLVHKVIPMLPRLLCENLCSLNPNVDRLAFSVFFQMKEDGEVLWDGPIRIGKSIINSCNKFSYDTVQDMIDRKIKSYEELPEKNKTRETVNGEKMFDSVLLLARLGMKRREKRVKNGVFSIEGVKKRFKLDEKFWPISYKSEERKEANFVVEEFMLLANQLVGKAMVKGCKSIAVLRQHCFPTVEKQKRLNEIAKEFGHHVEFESLASINKSIELLRNDPSVSFEKKLFLKRQLFVVLEQALYFVADQLQESEWHHFALNFDVYTHFTSPIRRYPDLLVHRVMENILLYKEEAVNHINRDSLLSIMDLCNTNKSNAKKVSDGCQKIFICLYLKDHCVESQGMVVSFGQSSMTLFIPDYEIQTTIFFEEYKDIKRCNVVKDKTGNKLELTYRTLQMLRENTISFSAYSPIVVSLTSTDTFPIDYKVKITLPDSDNKKISHVIQ